MAWKDGDLRHLAEGDTCQVVAACIVALEEQGCQRQVRMYNTTQNARGICGIGDAAYIAGQRVSHHSAVDHQLLTLRVWR